MRTLRHFGMICLVGQIIPSSCKQKEVIPSIDDLVGQYDCKIAINGTEKYNSFFNAKRFTVNKSLTVNQGMEVEVEYDHGTKYNEKWLVGYENGKLIMYNQEIARVPYGTPADSLPANAYYSIFQRASGSASKDNLYFDAIKYSSTRNTNDDTVRYWAKKKS